MIYGVRPKHLFREAATKYLLENQHKRSIETDAIHLEQLVKWIGNTALDQIHDGTLKPFVLHRQSDGKKNKTINLAMEVVRRILKLAACSWRDDFGQTWLQTAALITMLPTDDSRQPYPLSWDEQSHLLKHMAPHLQRMALFKANTGTREDEVCQLRWKWEVKVPELNTSVFLIPKKIVKNGEERLVVLNRVAASVIEECRGAHPEYVFTWKKGPAGKNWPTKSMNNTSWQTGRAAAAKTYGAAFGETAPTGFANVRVHDLKHTFGRRLRAAGVSLETRKVLLGHKNGDITSHYSAPEIEELIDAANRICETMSRKTHALVILKRKTA